jgi:hypothetical protein
MRSSFLRLYAVALRVLTVHRSLSQSGGTISGAGKTLSGECSSLSSLRLENEMRIISSLLDQKKVEGAKARAPGVIG